MRRSEESPWCERRAALLVLVVLLAAGARSQEISRHHPRLFIEKNGLRSIVSVARGGQKDDYARVKAAADLAVRNGIRFIDNDYAVPADLMNCGLTYLIERASGRESEKYADAIIRTWGDGSVIRDRAGSHFGYHAIAYDWIFDALTKAQRKKYGEALGEWLKWYTGKPEITLRAGSWWYNQTWGPSHLNIMHSRDAITQKLLIALAIRGAGTKYEADARSFIASWADRVPRECIPAFDRMGGVWAESAGHGGYGPVTVIPYAFEAWRTATGQNLFTEGKAWNYLREESRWLTYSKVPHVGRLAYIDDSSGSIDAGFGVCAPMVARALRDPLAQWMADDARKRFRYGRGYWQRLVARDASIKPRSASELDLPLAYCFKGAGHVFMRSQWGNPNATWAFFGAGPHFAGHAHDDEGHFMVSKKGGLITRGGGTSSNDADHYWGGSLIFNIVTIFDPGETFRRNRHNENDGGPLRWVYDNEYRERGHLVGYKSGQDFTYAAADLTDGYNKAKASEVFRQFVYLRGRREFIIVFDRVRSTKAGFAKHFMLHVPTRPTVTGKAVVAVPDHVVEYRGDSLTATWLSLPGNYGEGRKVLSEGRSRMFMRTLLPRDAVMTVRGGDGYDAWGHPLEKTAQYNHDKALGARRKRTPLAPWRFEVAAPLSKQTFFLHIFEIADEKTRSMQPVDLVETTSRVSVRIGDTRSRWEISFSKSGFLSAKLKSPKGKSVKLKPTLELQPQYDVWERVVGKTKGG
ncbi:MAG TPA: hypothetical protein ENK43_09170 [Planctomycetes bacterium]|nr:hypothetical protein [Planctomycetota bacterium]